MALLTKPEDVRRARAYLANRGLKVSDVPPKQFAEAATEGGKSFGETLKTIATIQLGTQGQGPAPIGTRIALAEAEAKK